MRSERKINKGNWKKRQIVWVFWDDGHVSELCEKWICYNGNYAYTKFKELRTRSSVVLLTREHKATISKDESNTCMDIDELQMFKDYTTKDKITTKTKNKDLLDKINNKIDMINKLNKKLAKVKADVAKKIELIYESMYELKDETYSDDSWLRLIELDKIDTIIDEALNVVWNTICVKIEWTLKRLR